MNNKELTFVDVLSIASFIIGLQNLDLNITQNDLVDQTKEIDEKADKRVNALLSEIHDHLKRQDEKIDTILERLGQNASDKETV